MNTCECKFDILGPMYLCYLGLSQVNCLESNVPYKRQEHLNLAQNIRKYVFAQLFVLTIQYYNTYTLEKLFISI